MLLLVLFQVLSSKALHDRFRRWTERIRLRVGRRVPVGSYRFDGEIGFSFGHDDTTLFLRLPVTDPLTPRTMRYIGMTDASTQFTVDRRIATPDELLEAYDDSLGPIEIQVHEPGRIAEIGIAATPTRTSSTAN